MKRPHIPHPLAPVASATTQVMTIAPTPREVVCLGNADDGDQTCRWYFERSHVATDLVTAASPRWLAWAVSEALAGRVPRTKAYLAPVLTGAHGVDLGRGPLSIPMVFGGAWCRPAWPDGCGCDDPDPARLPEHEGLAPRQRVVVEDAGDVVFDDFESMGWPAIRAPGGRA